jgi:acetate---CoA ligase (ADP-forming)
LTGRRRVLADGVGPNLDALFDPRVVAVVGATDEPGRIGSAVFQRARSNMEPTGAVVHPVNPRRDQVAGLRSYASVLDIEGPVDLAIILTGDPSSALADAVRKRVQFAIVFAGGFAETGGDGVTAQLRLRSIVEGSGTRLLGPNTTLVLYEQAAVPDDRPRVYGVTQGGGHSYFLQQARELGVPLVRSVPTGNEADLSVPDFISYFACLPDTGAVAAYCEGFADGRAFTRAVTEANAHGVPVVMAALGRSDRGRRTAVAHTGHLAGRYRVLEGIAAQYGVTLVDDLDELVEVTGLLGSEHPLGGGGVCVYTHSGGAAFHLTDLLVEAGVAMAELTADTQAKLRELLPHAPQVTNPVDVGGAVLSGRGLEALEIIGADPNVGVIVSAPTQVRNAAGGPERTADVMGQEAAAASRTVDKPICAIWYSYFLDEPAFKELRASRAHVFTNFRNFVSGVKARQTYARFVADGRARAEDQTGAARGRRSVRGCSARDLLESYGIAQPRERAIALDGPVGTAGDEVGWPIVAKISSPDIPHKSDVGLVALGQDDRQMLERTLADFREVVGGLPEETRIEGVTLSEQISAGVELIVGIAQDAAFGSVVMCGLGGIMAELFDDVSFRLPPFSRAEAERMLRETRAWRLLEGFRGEAGGSVDAAIDVIMRVQDMVVDLEGELVELDLNPVIVSSDRATAVDALAVWSADLTNTDPEVNHA